MTGSTNVTKLIGALDAQGRKFTDARNAVIVHALATGVKQSVIVAESGVDKGDVSRLNKVMGNLAPTKLRAIKGMSLVGLDATQPDTLAAAVKFGADNLRRVKPPVSGAAAGKGANTTTAQEDADPMAALHAWLLAATPDQFEARTALVLDVLATVSAEREAVAEEVAAA